MKSILIAEGNPSVASLFTIVFGDHRWKVTSFCDDNRAANALRGGKHYDVVLVSCELHGTNGVELINLVRALDHRKHTPVVMVTGTLGVDAEALGAGANEVLHKPIDIHTLVATVSKYIEGVRSLEQ